MMYWRTGLVIMSNLEYTIKELTPLLKAGVRRNNLINKNSPMHEAAKECYDHLLESNNYLWSDYSRQMNNKLIHNHLNITSESGIKEIDSELQSQYDIFCDDGMSFFDDNEKHNYHTNIKLVDSEDKRKLIKYYQPYFKPTGRISDLAVIHSISPVGLVSDNFKRGSASVCYTDLYKDEDLSCNLIIVDVKKNTTLDLKEFFQYKKGLKIFKIVYLVRDNAELNLERVFDNTHKEDSMRIIDSEIIQFPGSKLTVHSSGEGSKNTQDLMFITSYGDCYTDVTGRYLLQDENIQSSVVNVHHKGVDSFSRVDVRSVLEDKSTSTFLGEIKVDKNAIGIDADLSNKNLLCSKNATVITEPQLDINTKEIVCSHGCTVSNIDEQDIYYFETKGIDRQTASDIIKECFLK